MKKEGFWHRYIIKVMSSVFIALMNISIQVILPRAFSIEEYGYYSYNLNIFTSIVLMANLSMSDAMVAKFSKRNEETTIVGFYFCFFVIEVLVLNIAVLVLKSVGMAEDAFGYQPMVVILLGLEAAIVNKLLTDVNCVYDALAISRFPAAMNIILKLMMTAFVLAGYSIGILDLTFFYIIQMISTMAVIALLIFAIYKRKKHRNAIGNPGIKAYGLEFFLYCRPLVLSTIVNQIVIIIMNWALMNWAGASEQAIFGAAWQLNTLVGYVFSPYAELLKREFAVRDGANNEMVSLYTRSVKMMAWLTSYFAMYIFVVCSWIVPLVFGSQYNGAMVVTKIIMVYTVFQALGQVFGSYLLAREQTKVQACFASAGQFLTLLFVFVFQIPNFIWRQGLGATGIALNYLVVNIIITLWKFMFINKNLKIRKEGCLQAVIWPIAVTFVAAYVSKFLVGYFVTGYGMVSTFLAILLSGILYFGLLFVTLEMRPEVFGLTRDRLYELQKRVFGYITGKRSKR